MVRRVRIHRYVSPPLLVVLPPSWRGYGGEASQERDSSDECFLLRNPGLILSHLEMAQETW